MKRGAIAAMVFLAGIGARGEHLVQLPLDDPKVIAAMKSAWLQSVNGSAGTEGAFRLDGNPSDYVVVTVPFTNEFMKERLTIIPGRTFAVFHVHPTRGQAEPSPKDRQLADQYNLKMLTIHVNGLFEYDPIERKTIKIRVGLGWIMQSKMRAKA
jgi:hypothetical protein